MSWAGASWLVSSGSSSAEPALDGRTQRKELAEEEVVRALDDARLGSHPLGELHEVLNGAVGVAAARHEQEEAPRVQAIEAVHAEGRSHQGKTVEVGAALVHLRRDAGAEGIAQETQGARRR